MNGGPTMMIVEQYTCFYVSELKRKSNDILRRLFVYTLPTLRSMSAVKKLLRRCLRNFYYLV